MELRWEGWTGKLWIHLVTMGALIYVAAFFVFLFGQPQTIFVNHSNQKIKNVEIRYQAGGIPLVKRWKDLEPGESKQIIGSYAGMKLENIQVETGKSSISRPFRDQILWFSRLHIGFESKKTFSTNRTWIW